MQTLQQLQTGQLNGSRTIKLSCGLTEFPKELFQLVDSLELLDLSGNQLSSLPAEFKNFKKLKIAFFSDNLFTELPEVLGECSLLEMIGFKANRISKISEKAISKNIRWLILTNNQITKLPDSIGYCSRLQKVALAGNLISKLPETMANCQNIELLRISANQLNTLPKWIWQLPKLSWLAYSANPCFYSVSTANNIPLVNWDSIVLKEKLGEGASGNIYKAELNDTTPKTIAIKIFKGEVTSDGLPQSEMQACIKAGNHPNLVTLIGNLSNHPEQKNGLVLELIPSTFRNLGLPPSYITCTRDTFLPNTSFTIKTIYRIAQQVVLVMEHLHLQGIMHGDLYAHNIMIDDHANILLGDFGAASLYDVNLENTTVHQLLDVRAFGCLVDDLLQNLTETDTNNALNQKLNALANRCMASSIENPISFTELLSQL